MRWTAAILTLWLTACTAVGPSDGRRNAADVDALAQDYVRLVLAIDRLEPGYVDAYTGPSEWRTQAEHGAPRSVAELSAVADKLAERLRAMNVGAEPMTERRLRYLNASVGGVRFRLDMIDGKRLPFSDEAERLFALRPVLRPLSDYQPVLARIAALLPGDGPLNERVEAFRNRHAIPTDRLPRVMAAAIDECRRRTRAHYALPHTESFHMEFVTDQPWSAYNWYRGRGQSLIQINTDLPVFIDRALDLGCHEGYPGHHVQGMYAERMYRERGWVEFCVAPLYNPASPLNEGGGDYGVELAFPGDARLAFEARVLYPLAGLDAGTAPAYDALRRAMTELAGARLTIAAMYLDGGIDREQALKSIESYQLVARARAEQSLDFTERYRSYVINYASGEDLVRAYVERAGTDATERWAAFERIMAEPTVPADLAP